MRFKQFNPFPVVLHFLLARKLQLKFTKLKTIHRSNEDEGLKIRAFRPFETVAKETPKK